MNTPQIIIEAASVKVMRSHDYCHFEVCLSTSFPADLFKDAAESNHASAVDELRKTAARLADKAVEQYKVAKSESEKRMADKHSREYAIAEAKRIRTTPEGDRTVREQAALKSFDDAQWQARREYDYEDNWDDQNT